MVPAVLAGVLLALFIKDDKMKGDARARLFQQATAISSRVTMLKEYVTRAQELENKAQELVDKVAPLLSVDQRARDLYDKGQSMKMKAVFKENDLVEKCRRAIREYNDLVAEFNGIPRSVFFDRRDIPRLMEKIDEI